MRRGPWVISLDSEIGVLLDIHRGLTIPDKVEMRVTFGDHVTTILWSREKFLELANDVAAIERALSQPS